MFDRLRQNGFDVLIKNHAEAILTHDFSDVTVELIEIISGLEVDIGEIISGGGGETSFTQRLRRLLSEAGWPKHVFHVQTIVDGVEREGVSHEIDHVLHTPAGTLALEIEWNNKDPFYDRDLENFQRLHVQSAVSVGIIVTRGMSMQEAFRKRIEARLRLDGVDDEAGLARYGIQERTAAQRKAVVRMIEGGLDYVDAFTRNFVASKFGQATTHWTKLQARVDRGVGNPCPLLLIGLPDSILIG